MRSSFLTSIPLTLQPPMCGRFTLTSVPDPYAEIFRIDEIPEMPPRYNIAPTQEVAAVRSRTDDAGRELVMLRWGLVPHWVGRIVERSPLINARAETLASKPSFEEAFRLRRCLILADGYYEWQKRSTGKQPWHMRMSDGSVFGMAGLWERWQGHDGTVLSSCAIITTESNSLNQPIHDRMPVIVKPGDYDLWLDPTARRPSLLEPLLKPHSTGEGEMVAYPVNPLVNSVVNDSPACLDHVIDLPLFQDPPIER